MATIPLSTLGPRIGRISPDGVEYSERLAADAATQPSRTVVVTESVNRSRTCTSFVARPLAAAILLGLASGQALGQDADKVAIFMRAKLEHVQQVLEVLTLKDYDKIGKQAREMSLLSQAATWQVLQTAEYRDRSMVFRRGVDAITESARKKNWKERQLAYKHASMTCVYCHN